MKKQKKPFIIKLAILTVGTSIIWTGFDVYRRLTVKPNPDIPEEILEPISPELDQEVLNALQNTINLADDQLDDTLILSNEQI